MKQEFILWGLVIVVLSLLITLPPTEEPLSGRAVLQGEGCCLTTCTEMTGYGCPEGDFLEGVSCFDTPQCNLGCCIDTEGYCYTNYVQHACEQAGNTFVGARECGEYKECLIAPPHPADQEGYLFTEVEGVLLVQTLPSATIHGEKIELQAHLLYPEDTVEVQLNSSSGANRKTLLYDDGLAIDDVAGDEVYSGEFDTSIFLRTGAIEKVTIQTLIDGEPKGLSSSFFLAPDECIPSLTTWDGTKNHSVLFASRIPLSFPIESLGQSLFSQLVEDLSPYELYHVAQPIQKSDAVHLCNDRGTLIYLDNNEPGCVQQGDVVTLNPEFWLSGKPVTSPAFLDDFCSYVHTEAQLEEDIFRVLRAPTVTILNIQNESTFAADRIPLQFTASDNESERLRYTIYLSESDNEIAYGYMDINETVELDIPLQDGLHELVVAVEDMDYRSHADSRVIRVNHSNFILSSSLPPFFPSEQAVSVPFTTTHVFSSHVTYFFLSKGRSVDIGTAIVDEETTAEAFFAPGIHGVSVLAIDDEGRRARLFEREVNVSYTPSTGITGAAVFEQFAPQINSPFPAATPASEASSGLGVGDTHPVDESGFYEPQLLCFGPGSTSGTGDTGTRYRPAKCLDHENTTITAEARAKQFADDVFTYEVTYSIESCCEELLFDVRFHNDAFALEEPIARGTLGLGFSAVQSETVTSAANFSKYCITVSDEGVDNQPLCFPFEVSACENQLDDDQDGLCDVGGCTINGVDMPADPGCSAFFDDDEADGTSACQDGQDNDGDGLVDSSDPGCFNDFIDSNGNAVSEYVPTRDQESLFTTACQDGEDNDGDGLIDIADPGCLNDNDDNEADGTSACQDGTDNDGDGTCDFTGCIIGGTTLSPDPGCTSVTDDDELDSVATCEEHDTTILQKQLAKLPEGNDFRYEIEYSLFACKETISYRTCLSDQQSCSSSGAADLEASNLLFLDQDTTFITSVVTSQLFSFFCVQASDTAFGSQCFTLQ